MVLKALTPWPNKSHYGSDVVKIVTNNFFHWEGKGGTQPLLSLSKKAPHMTSTKHCTLWCTICSIRWREGKIVSDADRLKSGGFWWALSGNIVEDQPETVISDDSTKQLKVLNLNTSCWMKKESLAGLRTKFCMKDCGISSSVWSIWENIKTQ